jgi:hypothetical protein
VFFDEFGEVVEAGGYGEGEEEEAEEEAGVALGWCVSGFCGGWRVGCGLRGVVGPTCWYGYGYINLLRSCVSRASNINTCTTSFGTAVYPRLQSSSLACETADRQARPALSYRMK